MNEEVFGRVEDKMKVFDIMNGKKRKKLFGTLNATNMRQCNGTRSNT